MKFSNVLIGIALLFSASEAWAQQGAGGNGQTETTSGRGTFFVELGGPGFISANYDQRFSRQSPAGWGGRIGLGYFAVEDESFFTIPAQVNYLFGGKGGRFFEVGAGLSYVRTGFTEYRFDGSPGQKANDDIAMGTLTFGYRLQPVDGGFNFRVGLSPILREGNFIPYLPYLSFGYSF